MATSKGTLIAIGGHEDRKDDMAILRRVAELVGSKRLVVTTVGSSEPAELWADYDFAFHKLGMGDLVHLRIDTREQALSGQAMAALDGAGGVFFTGGDQLKITTQFGGTELWQAMHRICEQGGVIAGTSAGASVLSETMIVSGEATQAHRIGDFLRLSPGLGFIPGMVIDQHFAERGRISRLLGVVGQNPRALGIGIDEDTAIEIAGCTCSVRATASTCNRGSRRWSASPMTSSSGSKPEGLGFLMIMGGAEDKTGPTHILRELVRLLDGGKLVLATLASQEPEWQWDTYSRAFADLGFNNLRHLRADTREQIAGPAVLEMLEGSAGVFFAGGDQLQITAKIAGTAAYEKVRTLYKRERAIIAGTSAGAAAMGQMMLMAPEVEGTEKHAIRQAFIMARGLGLIRDTAIDQRFAQRARIERLVGAVAENPGVLGVGIDEDTAVIVDWKRLRVLGSGAVYVADGSSITYTNVAERAPDSTLCVHDLRLHVLVSGSTFDMENRRP